MELSKVATQLLLKLSLLLAMGLSLWDMLVLRAPAGTVTAEDSRLPTSSGLSLRLLKTSTTVLEVTRAERHIPAEVGGLVMFF
jgi:hypothetical protein